MKGCLLGAAYGDALGVPFEAKKSDHPAFKDWDGKSFLASEYHKTKPGEWSDDTAFSIAVAKSLIENKGFNPDDLAIRYIDLLHSNDKCKGAGKTTKQAVDNLNNGIHWSKSGVPGSIGNGTAMRAAPFGIFFRNDIKSMLEAVKIDARMTHDSIEAEAGSIAIAAAAYYAVNDPDWREDFYWLLNRIISHVPISKLRMILCGMMYSNSLTAKEGVAMVGTGFDVRETVPSVLFALYKIKNLHECVELLVRAGGDCDTNASLVGAIKGINQDIPNHIILENYQEIIDLDEKLLHSEINNF